MRRIIFTGIFIVVFILIIIVTRNIMSSNDDYLDTYEVDVYSDVLVSSLTNLDVYGDFKVDTSKIGIQQIDFKYLDNNVLYDKSIKINVVDNVPPYAMVSGKYYYVINSDFDSLDYIFAGDNYSKKVTKTLVGDYDINKLGTYNVKLVVSDESNNIFEKEFILEVVEKLENSSKKSISFDDIKKRVTDNSTLLIDVSKWQKEIDWKMVSNNGIRYAMIRVGTQKGFNLDSTLDEYFERNITEANKYGIKVGVYYYSYAINEEQAREQALWVVDKIKKYNISLPVVFDWECFSYFDDYSLNFYELNNIAKSFLDTIEDNGYVPMNYASKNYLENVWDLNYDVWLAHYTDKTNYSGNYYMWQFTNVGNIPGINGYVDVNLCYDCK